MNESGVQGDDCSSSDLTGLDAGAADLDAVT